MGIDKGRRWCFRRSDADLVIARRLPMRLGAHHVPNTKKPAANLEIDDNDFELSHLHTNVMIVYNKKLGAPHPSMRQPFATYKEITCTED
jgi:hypothetical protein